MAIKLDDFLDDDGIEEDGKQPEENAGEQTDKSSDEVPDDDYILPDSHRRKRKMLKYGGISLAAVVLVVGIYIAFFSPKVSNGQVRGYVILLEKKGLMFDSYEGVLIMDYPKEITDSAALVFPFSTTDRNAGLRINGAMKSDSIVVLKYRQYRHVLPWRGSTTTVVYDADCAKPTPMSRQR